MRIFVLSFLLVASAVMSAEKPNVLFLFADDLTFEAVRAFGHTDIDTPNLDKLANSGKVFTHAYNMGSWSGAVCVASRTMLNTGRYVWRAKSANLKEMQSQNLMWGQRMAGLGYDTFMTGKWHVAVPAEKVFKTAVHVRAGMPKDTPSSYNRPLPGKPDAWSPFDESLGGYWDGGTHWSVVAADDAIGYLNGGAGKQSPFFMYVAFNAAHDPRQSPAEYVAMYPKSRIKVPSNFIPEYPFKEEMGAGTKLRDEKLGPFPRTEEAVKVHRGEYYALITHLDAQIGRIMEALQKSGQADNTWIFFTADHGLALGHHGLFGKQNMFDPSLRVPFIVNGPSVTPGKIDAPIYLQDAMATSLDIAGGEVPKDVEFKSLLPLMHGTSGEPTAQPVYGAYLELQRAIVDDGWKLIVYPKASKLLLFHLTDDPDEVKDLATDPNQAPKVKEMFGKLLELQRSMDDTLDLTSLQP